MEDYTKPLINKLGFIDNEVIFVYNAPPNYESLIDADDHNLTVETDLKTLFDSMHIFITSQKELTDLIPKLLPNLASAGALWISWPKKSSGVQTDLTENTIREEIFKHKLVDVKVCTVTEIWSGLKCVFRKEHR